VDTDDDNRLKVYNAAGSWGNVRAPGTYVTPIITTSSDSGVVNTGAASTLGSWGTALSIATPATGAYDLVLELSIAIANTAAADRYVRVDLNRTSPSATHIEAQERILRQRVSASLPGLVYFNFRHVITLPTAASTYAFEVLAEADAANVTFGAGACQLVGDGAANRVHTASLYLRPV
jgi:hypothetical protein